MWAEIQAGDSDIASESIPGWGDQEFGALLLFAFGLEYGPDPRGLADFVNIDATRLDVSSYGRQFMDSVVDAYLVTSWNWLGAGRRALNDNHEPRGLTFAKMFVRELRSLSCTNPHVP